MAVLDRALQLQANTPTPMAQMAQRRIEANDRQQKNELMSLNIASKKRDAADRQNLTPLYDKWGKAASGPAGDADRQQTLGEIARVDPGKAQEMQKGQQDIRAKAEKFKQQQLDTTKQVFEMSEAKRKKAHEAAAQDAAKAQWAKEGGTERWDQVGFKDAKGQPIPFEKADSIIAKGKVMTGIFDFVGNVKQQQKTVLERDVPLISRIAGVSEKEALKMKMQGKKESESDIRAMLVSKLIPVTGGDGEEIEEKILELLPLILGPQPSQAPAGGAEQSGQQAPGGTPAGEGGDFSSLWK